MLHERFRDKSACSDQRDAGLKVELGSLMVRALPACWLRPPKSEAQRNLLCEEKDLILSPTPQKNCMTPVQGWISR